MIPGSNIFSMAASIISMQQVLYYRFLSRVTNSIGLDESDYDSPVIVSGSLQPIPRSRYEQLGLDFNRNYMTFYASKNIQDLGRDVSGDKLIYNGKVFDCLSSNDWFGIDGWLAITIIEVTAPVERQGDFFFSDDGLLNQYFTDDADTDPYVWRDGNIIYFSDDTLANRYYADDSLTNPYFGADVV